MGVAENSCVKLATAGSGGREVTGCGAGGLTGSAEGAGAGAALELPSVEKSCVKEPGALADGGAVGGGDDRTGSDAGALSGGLDTDTGWLNTGETDPVTSARACSKACSS
jgi:hypothetical protein